MRIGLRLVLVMLASLFLYACGGGGGGGNGSANTQGNLTFTFTPPLIDSNKLEGDEKITVSGECSTSDIFASNCTLETAKVSLNGHEAVIPLNLKINVKEKKDFDIVVLGNADKKIEPFVYLNDSNPSTSVTGWTVHSETIGSVDTKVIAYGNQVCTQKLDVLPPSQTVNTTTGGKATFTIYGGTPPYNVFSSDVSFSPSPQTVSASGGSFSVTVPANSSEAAVTLTVRDSVGENKKATLDIKKSATSLSASQAQTCEPVKAFKAMIPEYTPGTLMISSNSLKLEETAIGVLSGGGTGTVIKTAGGYQVEVTFNAGIPEGVPITASYVTPLKHLTQAVADEKDFMLTYGNLTLSLYNGMLVNSSGTAHGMLTDGKKITFTTALGYKGSPVAVSYLGDPFKYSGGEVIGKGNGVSKSFTLKTKHAPLVPDKLKVFSEKQPGIIQSVNLLTGDVTVYFATPPVNGENILASYVISEVSSIVKLEFSSNGKYQYDIPVRVKRP